MYFLLNLFVELFSLIWSFVSLRLLKSRFTYPEVSSTFEFGILNSLTFTSCLSLLRESLHCKFGTYPKGKCGDPMETISEILELIHQEYPIIYSMSIHYSRNNI